MKAKLSQRNERMRSTDLCVKASECVHPDPRLDLAATEITNSNAGSMTTSASPQWEGEAGSGDGGRAGPKPGRSVTRSTRLSAWMRSRLFCMPISCLPSL
jgi:hypothetical protein